MVPVSTIEAILLEDARQALLRRISPIVGKTDLEEAFAAWLVPTSVSNLSIDGAVKAALGAIGAERTYQHVAILGLAAQIRKLGSEEEDALRSGIQWVIGREPVVDGTPMGFCMDSIALTALALGAKTVADVLQLQRMRIAGFNDVEMQQRLGRGLAYGRNGYSQRSVLTSLFVGSAKRTMKLLLPGCE